MDWNTKTDQNIGSGHFSEGPQYLPQTSVYSSHQGSFSSQSISNSSSISREECMYSNLNSVTNSKNYNVNCTSQLRSLTTSSDVPLNGGGNACSESNYQQKNETVGHLDTIPSIQPDSMQRMCYSSNVQASQRSSSAVQSQANIEQVNLNLVPSNQYRIAATIANVGQLSLQQPHHSVKVPRVNIPSQECSILANEMRFVWVPANQNFNVPVSQGYLPISTHLNSQQRVGFQNVQNQATFANATMRFTNVSSQNSHIQFQPQYVNTQTPFQQHSTQVSQCATTSAIPQPIRTHLNSKQRVTVHVQNQATPANSAVLVANVPSQDLHIQSQPQYVSARPTSKLPESWPPKFVSNSTSQPVQNKQPIRNTNANVQNQTFLSNVANDLFIGMRLPQSSTPETISPTVNVYSTSCGSNITQLSYHEPLRPTNPVISNCSELESTNSNQTRVGISQSISRNGQEIQTIRTSPEQSKLALNVMPLQGSHSVYNPEMRDRVKESVDKLVHSTASLTDGGNSVITEEDMVREIKILLQAKENFLSLVKDFKEKRKMYKSVKCHKNMSSSNLQGSSIFPNLNCSKNAQNGPIPRNTNFQGPPPHHIAENLVCPLPLTSDRLVYQQNLGRHILASQQGNCVARVSSSNIHGLYRPENDQGNICSPASATLASLCTLSKERRNSPDHVSSFPGENCLQCEQNKPFTASDAQIKDFPDALVANRLEAIQENKYAGTASVVNYQSNNQYKYDGQQVTSDTEQQSNSQDNQIISVGQYSKESPLLTALLTEANQNSKLTGANQTYLNSLQEQNNVSPTNKDIEVLSNQTNLPRSNTNVTILENVANKTGLRLGEVKVVPPQSKTAKCQVAETQDALESCLDLWKISPSNNPAQGKPLSNTSIDAKQGLFFPDQNGRETLPISKPSIAVSNMNETHQGAVAGCKHESLDLTAIKAVETRIAIVNPLMLSKSKSPIIDKGNESTKNESFPVIQEGSTCTLLEKNKKIVMVDVSTMANIDVTAEANHPNMSNSNAVHGKLDSDDPMECVTDLGKMVTLTGSTNCRSVNQSNVSQSLQTVDKTEPQVLLERGQPSKPRSDPSCDKNHEPSKQTSLLCEGSSPDGQDFKLDDCVDDSFGEQLTISSFCTLVEGNTFYDSQIAQMFESIPSEENVVPGTAKGLESGTLKNAYAADVPQLLPDVQYVEAETKLPCLDQTLHMEEHDQMNSDKELPCHSKPKQANLSTWNREPVGKNELNVGCNLLSVPNEREDDFSKEKYSKEYAKLTDDQHNGWHSIETVTSEKEDYFICKEYHQESTPCTAEQLHKESECSDLNASAQCLNDQLSELQKEFPYGLERSEGTHLMEENLAMERKHLDESVCTEEQKSRLDKKCLISSSEVCSPGKNHSTNCVTERDFSENQPVEPQIKDCSISSTDSCDQERLVFINQSLDQLDSSEVRKVLPVADDHMSSPELCDSETEDSLSQIQITVLDSEQMLTLFPEMSAQSATDANMKCSQPNTEYQNENKENLSSINSEKACLVVSEGVDENSPNNEKPFCCLYRWLSSVYAGVPKCSCMPSDKDHIKSRLNSVETNHKEVGNGTTENSLIIAQSIENIESNDANKLSLCLKGKRRNSAAMGTDVKRIKGEDCSPMKVEHKFREHTVYQPLDKVRSEIMINHGTEKKRRIKCCVSNPVSSETKIKLKSKDHTSKRDMPEVEMPLNCDILEVDHNSNEFPREKCKRNLTNLPVSPKEKKKNGRLIVKTDFLKVKNSTAAAGLQKVKAQEMNLNDAANGELDKGTKNVDIGKIPSDLSHMQNKVELCNSKVKAWISAENKSLNKRKVPRKKLFAGKGVLAETVDPPSATFKDSNINEISLSKNEDSNFKRALTVHEYFQRRKSEHTKAMKKTVGGNGTKPKKKHVQNGKTRIHLEKCNKSEARIEQNYSKYLKSSDTIENCQPGHIKADPMKLKQCISANKDKPRVDGLPNNESKSKHMIDKSDPKLGTNVFLVNRGNDQSKTFLPGKDTKQSSKVYLNRVFFKSTSTERIHLTKLEFGFSPGKLGGERKSQKNLEPTVVKKAHSPVSQTGTEEPKMLEFKLCPEVLLNCKSPDEASVGVNTPVDKVRNSVEAGIRCNKEDWYKSIPLKKRKVDMAKFQDNALPDSITLKQNNFSTEKTTRPPTPGSKAMFHAYKQLYLEKTKSLDSTPKKERPST